MLTDLGWLLRELEVTATKQDRLSIGKNRRVEHASPINMGATELLRSIRKELRFAVGRFTYGVLPHVDARLWVWWLREHISEVVQRSDAAVVYRSIERMVGGLSSPGPIHDAINRTDTRFAGECPECGACCYGRHEDVYAVCDYCGTPVDIERNRTRTVIEYDLLPVQAMLNVLDNLNEHVSRVKLYGWITSGRLPSAGYLTASGVVACKGGPKDPRVYSLDRARNLRWREQTSQPALAPH
jgi:hypothetical protein